jgi:FkbM family methyltransferase
MNLSLLKKYFTPNSILDIGANIGQFYNECKEIFPNSYYYLIEGNDYCEENLTGLGVDFSISLLSDSEKDVDFYLRKNEIKCTGNSIYREKTPFFTDEEITIIRKKTNTLNNLIPDKTFDLIKIDVQGSEIDIINGGMDIINKTKGIILEVSLVEYNENSPMKNQVIEFMDKIGFYPAEILGTIGHPITHELIQEDLLFLRKKNDKIAVMTVLFDYPEHFIPTFYNNALRFFSKDDIHTVRLWNLVTEGSYYDKLFYYKVVGLLDYVEKNIKDKYDYILFLDGTDTNFISSPNNIIESFKSFNCSVLLGAEYGLWPPTNYVHLYENKPKLTDKFYLNSGTYIGYTDKIIYHLKDIIEKKYQEGIDDQGRWSIQYLLSDDIKIDQECKIFFSTYLSKKDVLINENIISLNNLEACIIHDNGPHGEDTLKLTNLL